MWRSNRFSNLFAQTQEISVKTFENTSPVKSTNSADRTTGELRTSMAWFFGCCWNILLSTVAKIVLIFSNRPKQRQLPPVKRSSLTHLWQTLFHWIFLTFKFVGSNFTFKSIQLCKKCLFGLKKVSTCEVLPWKVYSCAKSVFLAWKRWVPVYLCLEKHTALQKASFALDKGENLWSFALKNTQLCKKCLFDLKKVSKCPALPWKTYSCAKNVFLVWKMWTRVQFYLKSTQLCKKCFLVPEKGHH